MENSVLFKKGTATQYLNNYLPDHILGWVSIFNWYAALSLPKPDCIWKESSIVAVSSAW